MLFTTFIPDQCTKYGVQYLINHHLSKTEKHTEFNVQYRQYCY